ncbi:ATP-binding protein [Mucilaginibacter sp. 14171R-50]|uniref:ATP-binding protein n=1 Tax=Mucilaginibacter sp. 14171R-50 TaxID=2703789 RepID=UPI00138C5032|nr:ATP-binding protein [Mucilaginibacter sp. 14171R-50]QHS56458.1 ATP-binding protein [Mucilaginibacter sp. 14171R-50]
METEPFLKDIQTELAWLQEVIQQAIGFYLLHEGYDKNWTALPVPDLAGSGSPYADTVNGWNLTACQRIALALAMAPHIRPEILDVFYGRNQLTDRPFTEFGGCPEKGHPGFIPSGQTLSFLLTANDVLKSAELNKVLSDESVLIKEKVISLAEPDEGLPALDGQLIMSKEWVRYFITGEKTAPSYDPAFPAQKISTPMEWSDVVLDHATLAQVNEITTWLTHGEILMKDWGLINKIKPGYRVLFYGPPGTGKTLTATLIGKQTGRDVYRIDVSLVVDKYIGETEKNLSRIFDIATDKDWILFFDEADALFGKRTAASSSNDRHANQQTAYLLQRVEDYPGVVILATNLKANMDDAFTRRFQGMIHFAMPDVDERYTLWQNAFSGKCRLRPDIDVYRIAEEFELSGGAIINVLRYCAMSAVSRNDHLVTQSELLAGIRREYKKDNKTFTVNIL